MIPINQIYLGDCLEWMEYIDNKSIDMILCDLPYGVTANKKDKIIPFDKLWMQYNRVIKDNGVIALFAQGLFFVDIVNSNRQYYRYDLIWDKVLVTGFLNSKRMPLRVHEQIAIFYKKLPTYNPQFEEGKPQHSTGRAYELSKSPNKGGNYKEIDRLPDERAGNTLKYPKSILRFIKPHPAVSKHRTEKSIDCLEWLIRTYTNEGDLVLDNCIGSAPTIIACLNTKRQYLGFELDADTYNIAKERMEEHKQRIK